MIYFNFLGLLLTAWVAVSRQQETCKSWTHLRYIRTNEHTMIGTCSDCPNNRHCKKLEIKLNSQILIIDIFDIILVCSLGPKIISFNFPVVCFLFFITGTSEDNVFILLYV